LLSPAHSLARALELQGNLPAAAEVLEQACAGVNDGSQLSAVHGYKHHLLQLYRRMGDTERASRTEAELRQMLAVADADHPILVALNRERAHAGPRGNRR
jgi:hypothetical protein